ncbi:hypothetical protein P8A21_12785 [Streptomyces poriferorum]|uniref:hypothetical protein n=1 Tax=Streptomyces poriferorum TaxID=2798799 RepID=UPI00273D6086|nr:hypothetical protein [Streptomyces sp. Alt1]WLQ48322.1 hypothetical protein P8A21_12785 [Streptomyces sp. Alt1]
MAELVLCTGLDPDEPDSVTLVVIVAEGADGAEGGAADEDAVARLGLFGYEGDGCLYFVQTDGWAERRLDGELLTVDIVAYPAVLKGLEAAADLFPERAAADPEALRLLRVSAQVSPGTYAQAADITAVLTAPAGTPAEQVLAEARSGGHWPLILAPQPE